MVSMHRGMHSGLGGKGLAYELTLMHVFACTVQEDEEARAQEAVQRQELEAINEKMRSADEWGGHTCMSGVKDSPARIMAARASA